MPIQFKAKLRKKIPNLDLTKELKKVAEEVIKLDIIGGLNRSVDVNSKPFSPLKPATIKAKRLRGSANPTKPLVDTGLLRNSIRVKKKGRNKIIISIEGKRKLIAKYLQVDGVGSRRTKREFFGVSKQAAKEAISFMDLQIHKMLKKINNG